MDGELVRYEILVRAFDGDAIMIKAAQQWTFDALCPVLDDITCRKDFISMRLFRIIRTQLSRVF